MKTCLTCHTLFQEQTMTCPDCRGNLDEISLSEALELSDQEAFRERITGKRHQGLSDAYTQYHVRSYLRDRSLFLDFDLNKNRLKKGRRLRRFFIAPITLGSLFNLPWLFFNVISTNIFHLTHTDYCPTCDTKHVPGQHTADDCAYHREYFRILDDILSGRITTTRNIFEEYARETKKRGKRSAYTDLFQRPVRAEIFWDMASIMFSVMFWMFLLVYIIYPWVLVLGQQVERFERLEWREPQGS